MKETSQVSPVTSQILLPRSSKKRYADSFIGPKVSTAIGRNVYFSYHYYYKFRFQYFLKLPFNFIILKFLRNFSMFKNHHTRASYPPVQIIPRNFCCFVSVFREALSHWTDEVSGETHGLRHVGLLVDKQVAMASESHAVTRHHASLHVCAVIITLLTTDFRVC